MRIFIVLSFVQLVNGIPMKQMRVSHRWARGLALAEGVEACRCFGMLPNCRHRTRGRIYLPGLSFA